MPILGILELIEYEFEESGKKEIKLSREYFGFHNCIDMKTAVLWSTVVHSTM
jgi:hypothetical protein